MNTQPNNKRLLIIIGILLFANLVLVSFLILNKPTTKRYIRGDRKAMITSFLQNEIGFNQHQLQQYDSLNEQHRTKIKSMFDAARSDKENEFKQLAISNFSDSAIVNTATIFAGKQREIEITMFNHFKEIRTLCTPQQQPKFDSLFYKMLNRRNEDRKK
jgi:Spy/CpxP family protein refolding chaperone